MKARRRITIALIAVLSLLVVLNIVSAFLATRPRLQAKVFGVPKRRSVTPKDRGLRFEQVDYMRHAWGWWIPADHARASVVIVHGFDLSDAPVRYESSPLVELAADFHAAGFNALVMNLGYATGAHPYSGGRREAADIDAAVDWVKQREDRPVVLWGFSAGAHDVLVAAAKNGDVAAVAADSAFADTGEIVRQQAALTVHLPQPFLGLAPPLFSVFGARDTDVGAVWDHARKPVLIIHGTADTSISPSNAKRLQEITGGELWMVQGADHTASYEKERDTYRERAIRFVETAITTRR